MLESNRPPRPFPPERGEPLDSWSAFEAAVADLESDGRWLFRGVLSGWKPLTSLERARFAFDLHKSDLPRLERRLTRDFRRHPEGADALAGLADDIIFVWALMQHHGAPTRLMDWTYSPYVAAYFAFDELLRKLSTGSPDQRGSDKAAIWALNTKWLNSALSENVSADTYDVLRGKKTEPGQFEKILTTPPYCPFICTANPMVLNQRLSLQQGVFLCPGDITRSWRENLEALGWSESSASFHSVVLDFDATEAFRHLNRLNITGRTLFPGLDGYGKFMFARARLLLDLELFGEQS